MTQILSTVDHDVSVDAIDVRTAFASSLLSKDLALLTKRLISANPPKAVRNERLLDPFRPKLNIPH